MSRQSEAAFKRFKERLVTAAQAFPTCARDPPGPTLGSAGMPAPVRPSPSAYRAPGALSMRQRCT